MSRFTVPRTSPLGRLACLWALAATALPRAPVGAAAGDAAIPGLAEIPTYVVQRTPMPIEVDGRLDDAAWQQAPMTDAWRWLDTDEVARLDTRGQMVWDDEYLYFAFRTRDPDIWSTLQIRDEPVFIEEDFEIFLDPDGDEFNYYEWQINPLGTVYDVIWERPPQTPGPEA
ncbi:MAG: carbohydrate-binding family 9-like protein, partial [Gemmatimonadota bacterium]